MPHYPDDQPSTFWQRLVALWRWLLTRFTWRDDALSDIQGDVIAIRAALVDVVTLIKKEFTAMGVREDAAYEKLSGDIQTVKDGWASLVAERDQWKAAAEAVGADVAAQVQAALDADSEFDAAKVEAADAALAELVAPPVEEPPADNGGGEVIPDDGSGETPLDPNTGNE